VCVAAAAVAQAACWVARAACVAAAAVAVAACVAAAAIALAACAVANFVLDVIAFVVELILSIPIIGGIIRTILNWVTEIIWRAVGLIDFVASLVGIRLRKKMYFGVIVPSVNSTPIVPDVDIQRQVDAAITFYDSTCNINLIFSGICHISRKKRYSDKASDSRSFCVVCWNTRTEKKSPGFDGCIPKSARRESLSGSGGATRLVSATSRAFRRSGDIDRISISKRPQGLVSTGQRSGVPLL